MRSLPRSEAVCCAICCNCPIISPNAFMSEAISGLRAACDVEGCDDAPEVGAGSDICENPVEANKTELAMKDRKVRVRIRPLTELSQGTFCGSSSQKP